MIYEYHCGNCGNEFEHLRSMCSSEEDDTACESCGVRARRLISLPQARPAYAPYIDTGILAGGKPVWVDSPEVKKRLLKQRGLRVADPNPKPYQEWLDTKFAKFKEQKRKYGRVIDKNCAGARPKEAYTTRPDDSAALDKAVRAAKQQISSAVTNTA